MARVKLVDCAEGAAPPPLGKSQPFAFLPSTQIKTNTAHDEPIEPFYYDSNRLLLLFVYSETANLRSRNNKNENGLQIYSLGTAKLTTQLRLRSFGTSSSIRDFARGVARTAFALPGNERNGMELEQRVLSFSGRPFQVRAFGAKDDEKIAFAHCGWGSI